MHRHHWSYAVLVLLVGLIVPLAFAGRSVTAATASPADTVRAFYERHFAQGLAFTEENVAAQVPWFAPNLYTSLIAELRKPSSPDEGPRINGDPLTDTQEYPTSFKIRGIETARNTATRMVHFALPVGGHVVRVLLTRIGHNWRITDFRYEGGLSLRRLLRDGA